MVSVHALVSVRATIGDPGYQVNPPDHIVFIVDDDRRSAKRCPTSFSFDMQAVASVGCRVHGVCEARVPTCLVLDVELPDINGLGSAKQDRAGQINPISCSSPDMETFPLGARDEGGPVDFLSKPFKEPDLMRGDPCSARAESDAGAREASWRFASTFFIPDATRAGGAAAGASGLLNKTGRGRRGVSRSRSRFIAAGS